MSQQDALPGAQEAAPQEAPVQENGEPAVTTAPPVTTVVPEAHKAAWQKAVLQEAAAQENGEPAVTAPPVITVMPGAHEAAL